MSIKAIIFDLDGVLVSAKDIHYNALNEAISTVDNKYIISEHEHHLIYDGLKTYEKLDMLTKNKGLPKETHEKIWEAKQKKTIEKISNLKTDNNLVELFTLLCSKKNKIACCSNSIRKSVYTMLSKIGIIEYFDLILSNEDVTTAKPFPEIYWKAMSTLKCLPSETLIVEDSPNGLKAAEISGAKVYRVSNPSEVNITNIVNRINLEEKENSMENNTKWEDKNLNVLIPMAGAGSRFEKAGYTFPKPLIEVNHKPMIQAVVDNLNFDANHIFIVQKTHRDKYNLDTVLPLITHSPKILEVNEITEGAACTTLIAESEINNDNPLIIANSDQYVEWNTSKFMYKMQEQNVDAGIVTFRSTHPKWSFVKLNENGHVTEVAEKNPISDIATVGIYYWKKGSDYVKYAKQMISLNKRHNNEFYVCPVFNEAIADNKKIATYNIEKMWGLGTPEDLTYFLKNNKEI
jgi:HAD superfamily hydrolase (TIGR01509 family)